MNTANKAAQADEFAVPDIGKLVTSPLSRQTVELNRFAVGLSF